MDVAIHRALPVREEPPGLLLRSLLPAGRAGLGRDRGGSALALARTWRADPIGELKRRKRADFSRRGRSGPRGRSGVELLERLLFASFLLWSTVARAEAGPAPAPRV